MNAVTTKTITTKDTGETIDGVTVLCDYHMNGGYDWMELIEAEGWAVIPSWGCDGWDLGQRPYVMVAATRTADSIGNLFGVATYCEGDVSGTFYRTKARQWEAITEQLQPTERTPRPAMSSAGCPLPGIHGAWLLWP